METLEAQELVKKTQTFSKNRLKKHKQHIIKHPQKTNLANIHGPIQKLELYIKPKTNKNAHTTCNNNKKTNILSASQLV